MSTENNNQEKLIALLQLAYSGELAAAHAYRGHWRSVRNADEKMAIRNIEDDEWRHRKLVGEMLKGLGSDQASGASFAPLSLAERWACFVILPAGWRRCTGPESSRAAISESTKRLLVMRVTAVELILSIACWKWLKWNGSTNSISVPGQRTLHWEPTSLWPQPPAKETIRLSFEERHIGKYWRGVDGSTGTCIHGCLILAVVNRTQVFGVRRQSEAATALWMSDKLCFTFFSARSQRPRHLCGECF